MLKMALPQLVDGEKGDPNTFDYVPARLMDASSAQASTRATHNARHDDGLVSINDAEQLDSEPSTVRRPPPTVLPSLEVWMRIFYDSIPTFQRIASNDKSVEEALAASERFAETYRTSLDQLAKQALAQGNPNNSLVNCLVLCRLREEALRHSGFTDAFRSIKAEENAKALKILPSVLQELDAEPNLYARWEALIRGVCAANIFDLGAAHTANMYEQDGGVCFHQTRERLLPRPWIIDDLDAVVKRLAEGTPHRKALLFVDNAGSDVVLGMLPLARELVRRGTDVIIAANELPSINDITAAELDALLPDISRADPVLCKAIATRRLIVVSSGNDLPVIDLRSVSEDVVEAAGDSDLVVLEGMGRSIETNLNAVFSCDVLKIGMVKHKEVALCLGGRLLDCVVKFEAFDGEERS